MGEKKIIGEYDPIPAKESASYSLLTFGHGMIIMSLNTYLSWFYTDFAGLPVAFVGVIFLATRVIDAFTDIFMGWLVDHTKSKLGHCRPWFYRMAIPFALVMLCNFLVPETTVAGKIIYSAVCYVMTVCVFNTSISVPMATVMSRITRNPNSQKRLNTLLPIFNVLATLSISFVQIPLLRAFGFNKRAFLYVYIIYAAIGVFGLLVGNSGITERVETIALKDQQQKRSFRKDFGMLLKNKYWVIAVIGFLGFSVQSGLAGNNIYFYTYVLGDAGLNAVMSLVSIIPGFACAAFMPAIYKRIRDRRPLLCVCQFLTVVLYMSVYFVSQSGPESVGIVIILFIFRSLFQAPYIAIMFGLIVESIEYGEWKNGIRTEGLAFSMQSFGQKMGIALSTGLGAFILAAGGYDGTAAVQTPEALNAIRHSVTTLGAAGMLIIFISVCLFDLHLQLPKIIEDLKARRAAQSTAATGSGNNG